MTDPKAMLALADKALAKFHHKEMRVKCRLAWNNWPDNENSRRQIDAQEARDPISAAAWDRVVAAVTKSAPEMDAPHNHGERLPNSDAANLGADALQCVLHSCVLAIKAVWTGNDFALRDQVIEAVRLLAIHADQGK